MSPAERTLSPQSGGPSSSLSPSEDAAAAAGRALNRALDALGDQRTPCQDEGNQALFFDEHAGVREEAAQACLSCPALPLCGAYADLHGERWGVWGGADRQALSTSTVHRRRRAALLAAGVTP